MREGEPGWYYIGNGQLRYKDGTGWTDQYQYIDTAAPVLPAMPRQTDMSNSSGSGVTGVDWALWAARFARILSIRVIVGATVGSLIFAALLGALWKPLTYSFFLILPLSLLGWFFNDDQELKCPYCRKLVKLGATTCHHCGRVVARSQRG